MTIAGALETRIRDTLAIVAKLGTRHSPPVMTDDEVRDLAARMTAEVGATATALIADRRIRGSVVARPEVVARWPWSAGSKLEPWGVAGGFFIVRGTPLSARWPGEAAPADVISWACSALKGQIPAIAADGTVSWGDLAGRVTIGGHSISWVALALLRVVEREVVQAQSRPVIAVDAGHVHRDLLAGWTALPKPRSSEISLRPDKSVNRDGPRRYRVFEPGRSIQLSLEFEGSPSEALVHAIRDFRGFSGLRNYTGLLRLLSMEGGQTGTVRWLLDSHMEALGMTRARRSQREDASRQVALLTQLEIGTLDSNGKTLVSSPIFLVGEKRRRLDDDNVWQLDGLVFRVNRLIWDGVCGADGEPGRNWFPVPAELAQVDHVRHPYAYPIGLCLPQRWRYLMGEIEHARGEPPPALTLAISGAKMLEMGAIRTRWPGETWDALASTLDVLQGIGHVGSWRWRDGTPSPESILEISPAKWLEDRALRSLPPAPPPALLPAAIATGADLATWRAGKTLSKEAAAALLGVSRDTLERAERSPAKQISPRLKAAILARGK